jgi:uncharacterized repeat protein (TIGR04138 family)
MRNENFERAVSQILKRDKRYPRGAYDIMPIALDYTVRQIQERARAGKSLENGSSSRHVTGRQLAEGFRDYILEEFGPFSEEILNDLNLHATIDIGHLVFNLISVGCFGKTPEDSLEDFEDVYDFKDAFSEPFSVRAPEFYQDKEI